MEEQGQLPEDPSQKLYKNLSSYGMSTAELGTAAEFSQKLSDPANAAKLYKNLSSYGMTASELGSPDEFVSRLSKKKAQSVSAPSFDASNLLSQKALGGPIDPVVVTDKGKADLHAQQHQALQSAYDKSDALNKQLHDQYLGYQAAHEGIAPPDVSVGGNDKMQAAGKENSAAQNAWLAADANFISPAVSATSRAILGTSHGLVQMNKDAYNSISEAITGKKILPEGDVFGDIDKKIQGITTDKYDYNHTGSTISEIAHGVGSGAPLVIMGLVTGGGSTVEGGAAEALPWASRFGQRVIEKIPQALKMATAMGSTEGFTTYGSRRSNGASIGEAATDAGKAAGEGAVSGLEMEGMSFLGEGLGTTLTSKLAKMGLVRDGKLIPSALKTLSNMTVFGGGSVAGDVMNKRSVDWDKAATSAGVGAAFELGHLAGSAKEDVIAGNKRAQEAQKILDLQSVTPEQVAQVHDLPTSAVDLQANAIKTGVEAEHAENPTEKAAKQEAAVALQKAANIKGMSEDIIDHKDAIIEKIQSAPDIHPDDKAKMIEQINAIHDVLSPIAREKSSLSAKIQEGEGKVAVLNDILSTSTDPIHKAEAQAHLENVVPQIQKAQADLKALAAGHINGTITHAGGQIIDSNAPQGPSAPVAPNPNMPSPTDAPASVPNVEALNPNALTINTNEANTQAGSPQTGAEGQPSQAESTGPQNEAIGGVPQEEGGNQGQGQTNDAPQEGPQTTSDGSAQGAQAEATAQTPQVAPQTPTHNSGPQEGDSVSFIDNIGEKQGGTVQSIDPDGRYAIQNDRGIIYKVDPEKVQSHEIPTAQEAGNNGTPPPDIKDAPRVGDNTEFVTNRKRSSRGKIRDILPDGTHVMEGKKGLEYIPNSQIGSEVAHALQGDQAYTDNGRREYVDKEILNTMDSPAPSGINQWNGEEIQVQPIIGKTPKHLRQITEDLQKGLRISITYKKLANEPRKALAIYRPSVRIIKMGQIDGFRGLSHEVGHSISDDHSFHKTISESPDSEKLKADLKNLAKGMSEYNDNLTPEQVNSLPDESKKTRAEKVKKFTEEEGIAQLVRFHIINPDLTEAKYPELIDLYKKSIPNDIQKVVTQYSNDYRTWEGADAHLKAVSRIEDFSKKEIKPNFFSSLFNKGKYGTADFGYTNLDKAQIGITDSKHFLYKSWDHLSDITGYDDTELGTKFLKKMARTFAGQDAKIQSMFDHGLHDASEPVKFDPKAKYRYDVNYLIDEKTGERKSGAWLYGPYDKDPVQFKKDSDFANAYMVAKKTIEMSDHFGRDTDLTGIGAGDQTDRQVAKDIMEQYDNLDPKDKVKYDEIARRYHVFADDLMRYRVEKGHMSREQYQHIKDNHLDYVALYRNRVEDVGSDISQYVTGVGKANEGLGVDRSALFRKKAEGSNQEIRNPYASLAELAVKSVNEADRNAIMQIFAEPLIQLHRQGIGDGKPINIAEIGKLVDKPTDNSVTVYFAGEPFHIDLHPEIKESLTDASKSDSFGGAMINTAQLLRFGVTKMPAFMTRNFLKDTVERVIKTRSDGHFWEHLAAFWDKGTASDQLLEIAGGSQNGHYMKTHEEYNKHLFDSVTKIQSGKDTDMPNAIVLTKKAWHSLGEKYEKAQQSNEFVNRKAEFTMALKTAEKKGLNPYHATMHAAFEARDLMDFAVGGKWFKAFNKVAPFTNAGMQGLLRSASVAKSNPAGFIFRLGLNLIAPTIMARMAISANPEWEKKYLQFPSHIKDMYNYYGTYAGHDILVPKPYELAIPGAGINRAIDKYYFGDKNAFDGYMGQALETLIPVSPSGVNIAGTRTLFEMSSNHKQYQNSPIIPLSQQNKDYEYNRPKFGTASRFSRIISEAGYQTSKLLPDKDLQDVLRWDPRKIDFAIQSLAGGLGDLALKTTSIGDGNKRNNIDLLRLTGLAQKTSVYNSRDVQWVLKTITSMGTDQKDGRYKDLVTMMSKYNDLDDEKEKSALESKIIDKAQKYREQIESHHEFEKGILSAQKKQDNIDKHKKQKQEEKAKVASSSQ